MQNTRPDLKVPYSSFEKLLEVLSITILLLGGLLIWKSYPSLPETVPARFNFSGQVIAMGPRSNLIYLYSSTSCLYLLLSVLSRYPRFFNYPTAITNENAPEKYQQARMLNNTTKLEVLGLLTFIAWAVISTAKEGSPPPALIPVVLIFMALIFSTMILFFIKLMKRSD